MKIPNNAATELFGNGFGIELLITIVILVFALICIIGYILNAIVTWRLFKKAGEKRWKALIPGYNLYTVYRITWKTSMFWIRFTLLLIFIMLCRSSNQIVSYLLLISSIVYHIIRAMTCYRVSRAFGHGMGYTVGLIFASVVFGFIIAFGKSKYIGNTFILDVI